ncbi:hypothetical protein LCGC14_2469310 [marine sediment metagenome]|uniref:Uncharacterized protein n=1 Tax=marine sediment metagenome TaxID=412755 RepID=A0A0F9DMZ0_9ZZZZ
MARQVRWLGSQIKDCEYCFMPIENVFYDASVPLNTAGVWMRICEECFKEFRCSLGSGFGQKYERIGEEWLLTAG